MSLIKPNIYSTLMKKLSITIMAFVAVATMSFKPVPEKLVSKDTHISFFSHTIAEDITANNYKVVSTLDKSTGEIVFSVPMQSFEFEKALMQKHFNSKDFLDTKEFPKAKYTGKITNLSEINLTKDGNYEAMAKGELTIKGVTNPVNEKGTIKVEGNKITLTVIMNITLADYKISFSKGKPSTNVAKQVEATVNAIYTDKP